MIKRLISHWAPCEQGPLGCHLPRIRSGLIAKASRGEGGGLVCFSHRALAFLPSPLLEINYYFRLYKSVDLLENKRFYGRTLDLSFMTWS